MSNKSKAFKKSFQCNKCRREFKARHHLDNHLRRKTPCDKIFKCFKCHKIFSNGSELKRHQNRVTSCVPESVPVITNNNEENRCHYCGNEYANTYNLKRHQKTCSVMKNPEILITLVNEQKKMIETQSQMLQSFISNQSPQTIINGDVNIQNNVENNLYLNVTICSFGNEDLSRLDAAQVMNLIKNHAQDFVPKMIEHVHANPDLPEFHNVFYDPNREKAIVFAPISASEKSWQVQDFREVSAQLTKKIKEHVRPGAGPYFDQAMKVRDIETSNTIINIVNEVNWETEEILDKNRGSLSKVSKNKGFLELVTVKD